MKYSGLEGGEGLQDVISSALDFESFLDEVWVEISSPGKISWVFLGPRSNAAKCQSCRVSPGVCDWLWGRSSGGDRGRWVERIFLFSQSRALELVSLLWLGDVVEMLKKFLTVPWSGMISLVWGSSWWSGVTLASFLFEGNGLPGQTSREKFEETLSEKFS